MDRRATINIQVFSLSNVDSQPLVKSSPERATMIYSLFLLPPSLSSLGCNLYFLLSFSLSNIFFSTITDLRKFFSQECQVIFVITLEIYIRVYCSVGSRQGWQPRLAYSSWKPLSFHQLAPSTCLVQLLSTHNGLYIFLIKGRRVLPPSSPPSRCNESPLAGRNKCKKLEEKFFIHRIFLEAELSCTIMRRKLCRIFFFSFFLNKRIDKGGIVVWKGGQRRMKDNEEIFFKCFGYF